MDISRLCPLLFSAPYPASVFRLRIPRYQPRALCPCVSGHLQEFSLFSIQKTSSNLLPNGGASRSHRSVLGVYSVEGQVCSRLDSCPLGPASCRCPENPRGPLPPPQAYVATSYDLSSLQSDVGLLEFPGSPPPSSLGLVTISIVLASKGLDLRQLEQELRN